MASCDSVCLVARAIPMNNSSADETDPIGMANSLAAHLGALSLGSNSNKKETDKRVEERKKMREEANTSPADHLALQSLRSSALARKTNTTTKLTRDCRKLFADLMMGGDEEEIKPKMAENAKKAEKKAPNTDCVQQNNVQQEKEAESEGRQKCQQNDAKEKKEEKKKDAEEQQQQQLLARGPLRVPPMCRNGGGPSSVYHPYACPISASASAHHSTPTNEFMGPSVSFNATALHSTVFDQSSYNSMASAGYGYECGLPSNWSCGVGSAGRDSALSSPSTTPDIVSVPSPGVRGERSELPDDLSDFILEYSRRYSPELSRKHSLGSQGVAGGSPQSSNSSAEEDQLSLSSNGGNSPLCAPQTSPAAPRGGIAMASGEQSPQFNGTPKGGLSERARPAKERLRAMIRGEEMDDAWAWTCKCIQRHPLALQFRDADGDTLLHIVTAHLDFGKIYALVEQMLKSQTQPLPFDVPNGMGETPYTSFAIFNN